MEKNQTIIAAIHIFNMLQVPFNRGLKEFGGELTKPREKFELLKTTVESYINHDPGTDLNLFVIVNQGTDCELTKSYLDKLNLSKTSYGTPIFVLDAPDKFWPGPFGSRNFVFNKFPDFDYYFESDSDNMTIQDGWLKLLVNKMESNPKIGLLGAYLDRKGFQAPNTVKWITKEGKEIPPPTIKYNSGAWTFVPKHIFEDFTKYWGKNWVNQGKCFFDYAGAMGELYFAFRVEQLGYINEDLTGEDTDAPYDWIVPDRLFPNYTVGKTNTYPTKKYISPFYNTYLAMKDPNKVKWIQKRYKNCVRIKD